MYNKCNFTFISYLSQLVLVFTLKAVALNVRCDWVIFGLGNILTVHGHYGNEDIANKLVW
jgi:hypothetical protein